VTEVHAEEFPFDDLVAVFPIQNSNFVSAMSHLTCNQKGSEFGTLPSNRLNTPNSFVVSPIGERVVAIVCGILTLVKEVLNSIELLLKRVRQGCNRVFVSLGDHSF